jgi:phosphatidate cytidylyltransferase
MSSGAKLRVLTGAVLIPVVVATVWWGSAWLVAGLAGVVAVLALLEFFALAERLGFQAYRVWTCVAALGIFSQQWYAAELASNSSPGDLLAQAQSPQLSLELVLFGFLLGVAAIALWSRRPLAELLPSFSVSSAGLLAVALPLSALVRLDGVDMIGRQLLLFILVVVWVGDTAAYLVGRGFGRLKMSPQLSPQKTWEGAAANLLGALLVGVLFDYWLNISLTHLLLMAAIGSIAGQAGDLLESAYKRSAGVKDSGTILPGHGGMLDRIDALLLAAPAVWYYFEWAVMRRG